MSTEETHTGNRRGRLLVNKSAQLTTSTIGVAAVVAILLLQWAMHAILDRGADLGEASSTRAENLAILFNGLYFLFLLAALGVAMVLLTHRVAGPAMALEAAVRGFLVGDYGQRTTIRKHDMLHGLSDGLCKLGGKLRRDDEERSRLLGELQDCLAARDFEKAERLVGELSATVRPVEALAEAPESAADDAGRPTEALER